MRGEQAGFAWRMAAAWSKVACSSSRLLLVDGHSMVSWGRELRELLAAGAVTSREALS